MPYIFLNENVFMGGIGVLIVALILLRVKVARQRRLREEPQEPIPTPPRNNDNATPLV